MHTLTIAQIFNDFDLYQAQYQNILQDPQQYYIPVQAATLEIWPFPKKNLYLGDLLQLWFNQTWLINQVSESKHAIETQHNWFAKTSVQQHIYAFAISGNVVLGKTYLACWSVEQQCIISLEIEQSLKYVWTYQLLQKPHQTLRVEHANGV